MDVNGLSLFNAGTSLDLDALKQTNANNCRQNSDHEESDDGDEEETQKRNAELQNELKNAFDDLIDDESELENTADETQYSEPRPKRLQSKEVISNGSRFVTTENEYRGDSLYSPLHDGGDLSTTQYSLNNNSPPKSAGYKNTRVRFSQIEDSSAQPYRPHWNNVDEAEKEYLSSGLNSTSELKILYAARGSEISKLSTQLHDLQHKVALLEGEKTGLTVTLQNSEQVLRDCREENACLKDEIASLNDRLLHMTEDNREMTTKMNSADNKIISLERQILDMNMFQANQRDANRQEVLFSSIKTRYDNDLRTLRDELSRVRTELEMKSESLATCERKLREVTEMHERTLMERAANLQEFNRALDQQRQLREQRDTLTSAALLEQLSKAKEEIDRLKTERVSQALSDSMAQMRIGGKERDTKQLERTISSLEQRLAAADKKAQSTEDLLRQVQQEKQTLSSQLTNLSESSQQNASEFEKLLKELDSVKELYLKICQEKDLLEDHIHQMSNERADLEAERKLLLKDLEDANRHTEEAVQRHLTTLDANFQAKLETAVKESVAKARLEWIKEQAADQFSQHTHVERSMGELQVLHETMDVLRHERDQLQNDAIKRQQQIKLERHLLLEKFKIEKEMLNKGWEDKVAALNEKLESIQKNDELVMATVQEKFKVEKEMLIKNCQDKMAALEERLQSQEKNGEVMRSTVQEQFRVEKELLTKSLQDKIAALEAKLETEELMKSTLRDKFKLEKEKLIKNWQDKVTLLEGKLENQEKNDELMKATADAMARLRQQCEEEKLSLINSYEARINNLQSTASTPVALSSACPPGSSEWKADVSKIRMSLKNAKVPLDVLVSLEGVVQKVDALLQRDQETVQHQVDKYRNLKRRVRDYQKYATDKLAKYKAEKQQSEDYCRQVITELLEKVSNELRQCQSESDRRNANVHPPARVVSAAIGEAKPSNFVQSIDDLQREVNQYILGLTNFNSK